MVRADVFDAIDYSLRVHRKKLTQPFGGVQVIVFGDLFNYPQLSIWMSLVYLREFIQMVNFSFILISFKTPV